MIWRAVAVIAFAMISAFPLMKLDDRENCRRYVRSVILLYRLRFVKFTFPHITMIVENRIVRNFRCTLLATFGIMSVMLFIWCFDSTLAPYPMNSFFVPFFKNVRSIDINKRTLTDKTPNDYEFDYIDIGSVTYGVHGFSSERMIFDNSPSRARRIVKKGDTIISTVRTYLKAIASIDDDVSDLIVSTGFAVVSPKKLVFSKYFSYWLTANYTIDEICALSTGVSYPATNASAISNLFCLVPPLSEQKAIADYLDKKTAQIDQIIQTINTQIEKLKELRKTLINDVVTGKIKVIE